MELEDFFRDNNKVALGFSGGADSAFLLYAAKRYHADVQPYFIHTAFQPAFELEDAKRLADICGAELKVIHLDILKEMHVRENPPDRCYYCKKAMFRALKACAAQDGYDIVTDGTNASDDADDRPGMRALEELGICSPLRMCGLTKARIRCLSREAGLFTWNKPAYACLATRISTGQTLHEELLQKVEKAEDTLKRMGFLDFRVRVFHGAARLQLPQTQFLAVVSNHSEVTEALKPYFKEILLDLMPRETS